MKRLAIGIILVAATFSANAADERQALSVVKKYSEAVACNISDYKAVKVRSFEGLDGVGDLFLVHWSGDLGCAGGTGTTNPQFTVVEQQHSSSDSLVVVTNYKFPELIIKYVTSFSVKNSQIIIKGVRYGDKDPQSNPTKAITYKLKFVEDAFVKQ